MNYVLSLMKEIIGKRKLIWDLGKADFRKRFVGSYFGVVWMFIQPIVTVSIYAVVFGMGFKSPPPIEGFTYVEYLVKKVVFKVEILPIIKLISCLLVHAFFVVIMFGMYLIIGRMPSVIWFQLVYYSLAASLLALGIGFFTSAVNVFFKDMAQIVSICLQFGIWMTPIMYHESMFTGAGKWVEVLFKLNPFYYVVAGYRDTMLTGNWFWERPTLTLYYWGFTAVVLLLGLKMFKRLRPHFSDVL